MDTFVLGVHVLLAAILVGPQVLLFYAVVPSTWLITDERLRRNVTAVVTQRFGWLAGIAIAGLVLTGLVQLNSRHVGPEIRDHMMSYAFGPIFLTKMAMFVTLLVLIGVHGAVFGRRIRATSEAVERGEVEASELEAARRASLLFSTLILIASVVVLFLGVALAGEGAREPR
jgi:uncharacterized membrane protein